jgi:hypothetical protein
MEAYRIRESELERKIGNLTLALADGYSPAITSELARTEAELDTIRVRTSCRGTIAAQMRNTRQFVKSRLRDLRALFSSEAVAIRDEIAKHVQKIVLTPEGRSYVALGSWNLLAWQHGWCRGPD